MSATDKKLGEILGAQPEERGKHLITVLRQAANHLENSLALMPNITMLDVKIEPLVERGESGSDLFRLTVHAVEITDEVDLLGAVALAIHENRKRR